MSPNVLQRLTGIFLGGVIWQQTENAGENPENGAALRRVIVYANTTLAAVTENHLDPLIADPDREKRIVLEIQEWARTHEELADIVVQPWQARSETDIESWRFIPTPHGTKEPPVIEHPLRDLRHPDEESAKLRGFVQAKVAVNRTGITVEADVAGNAVFLNLMGTVETARAEKELRIEMPGLQNAFDRLYRRTYPNPHSPAAKNRMAKLPVYIQFMETELYEARLGEADPRIESETVKEALEKTKETRRKILDTNRLMEQAKEVLKEKYGNIRPSARDVKEQASRIVYDLVKNELWPVVQELYQLSEHAALAQEFWNKEAEAGRLNELRDKLTNAGAKLPKNLPLQMPDGTPLSLEELFKRINEQNRRKILDELGKEARNLPESERKNLAERAHEKLREAEKRLADDLANAAQEAQKQLQNEERQAQTRQESSRLQNKIKAIQNLTGEIKKLVEDIGNKSRQIQAGAKGVREQAKDIASESGAGAGRISPLNTEALEQAAKALLNQVKELQGMTQQITSDAKSAGNQSRITPELKNTVAGLESQVNKLDKNAREALSEAGKTKDAAGALNDQVRTNPDDTPGVRAKVQDIDTGASKVSEHIGQVKKGAGEVNDSLTEVESLLKDIQDGSPSPWRGEGGGEGEPHVSIISRIPKELREAMKEIQQQEESQPKETPDQAQKHRKLEFEAEIAARKGFTLDEWHWWQDFLEPVQSVISTLSDYFAAGLNGAIKDIELPGLISGNRMNDSDIHMIFTDGRVFVEELEPDAIHLLLEMLVDASGSMGKAGKPDKDKSPSKFYQTVQAFAAISLAFIKAKEKSQRPDKLILEEEIRAYAEEPNQIMHPFEVEPTEKTVYKAVKDIFSIRERLATADVPTFRAAVEALHKRSSESGFRGMGLINAGDGNPGSSVTSSIQEIYDTPEARDIEFLSVGVGEGAEDIEKSYKSEEHTNVRAVHVEDSRTLGEHIFKLAVDMFDRMIEKAQMPDKAVPFLTAVTIGAAFFQVFMSYWPQAIIAVPLIISMVPLYRRIQHAKGWRRTLLSSILAVSVLLATTVLFGNSDLVAAGSGGEALSSFRISLRNIPAVSILPGVLLGITTTADGTQKPYKFRDIKGISHLIMWDKWGGEARMPVRQDTSMFSADQDNITYTVERHRITVTDKNKNISIEGTWNGAKWVWLKEDSEGEISGLGDEPPDWLKIQEESEDNISIKDKTNFIFRSSCQWFLGLVTYKRDNGGRRTGLQCSVSKTCI